MSARTALTAAFGIGGAALFGLWVTGRLGDAGPGPSSVDPGVLVERPSGTRALVARLRGTRLRNGDEIDRRPGLEGGPRGFGEAAPAARWRASRFADTEVCGVRFRGPDRVDYRLQTFPDRGSALAAGYLITHRGHCGACSSLGNLAVYLERPDLTSPARACARKWTASGVKACFVREIGFSERCAEAWTANALHTRRHCAGACIRHYGPWSVLVNDMRAPHTDERGNLNPCLACDERVSGPGFQYAAGRTRRNSGLTSAIARAPEEIYPVDHGVYFR